jgi:hypothetical protein
MFVHQGKYTKDILKKFDMGEAKPLSTPISTTPVLDAMRTMSLWTRRST